MKPDAGAMNLLAVMADAEARHTASLIEMVAAAVLLKTHPPARGDDVVSVTISKADIDEAIRQFHFEARYDEHGAMTLYLTPLGAERLIPEQSTEDDQSPEVTSD